MNYAANPTKKVRLVSGAFLERAAMASQVSGTTPAAPMNLYATDGTFFGWVRYILTKRRIAISMFLFTTLVLLDLFVFQVKPRNLLNFSDPLVVLGEILVVLGVAIRTWAAGTLHKLKQVTRSGPYAMVRNPLYVGSFLMMFGFCALLQDAHTIWVVLGPLAFMYWLKVRQEETWLSQLFEKDWDDYIKTTPRFVPNRLALPSVSGFSWSQWMKHREWQAPAACALAFVGLQCWHVWF